MSSESHPGRTDKEKQVPPATQMSLRNPSKDKGRHAIITLHGCQCERYFIVAVEVNGETRAPTSFPEKVQRHQVQHGVLDVVDLLLKR